MATRSTKETYQIVAPENRHKKAALISGSRVNKGGGGEGIRTPVLVTRIPDLYMLIRSSDLGKPAPADRIRLPDCHCNLSLLSPDTRP